VAHYRALAEVDGHGAGNQECRQQAENDVFAGVPVGEAHRFQHRVIEAVRTRRDKVDHQESGEDGQQ